MLTLDVSVLVEKLPERLVGVDLGGAAREAPCYTALFLVIERQTKRIAKGCEGPFRCIGLGFF